MKNFNNDNKASLRVAETNSKFVGRGMALVDPKVMEEMDLINGRCLRNIRQEEKLCAPLVKSARGSR